MSVSLEYDLAAMPLVLEDVAIRVPLESVREDFFIAPVITDFLSG